MGETLADAAAPSSGCVPMRGAAWLCPPGFSVDSATKQTAGTLPRCAPDPQDCGATPYAPWPAGDVLHVDAAHAGASDGTAAAPFTTLAAALVVAKPGATVLLAAGTYTAGIELKQPVNLVGRCAAKVTLIGQGDVSTLTISGTNAGPVGLQRLTITGPNKAVVVDGGARATLDRVRITLARSVGLKASGAATSVAIKNTLIDDCLELLNAKDPSNEKQFGRALDVRAGAAVELTDVRASHNRDQAISLGGAGSTLTATGLIVDATRENAAHGLLGIGLVVGAGTHATLRDARVHANRDVGVFVREAGAMLTARNLVIDATRGSLTAQDAGHHGEGLIVIGGGRAVLEGARVVNNHRTGIALDGEGTELLATAALIADTKPEKSGFYGRGVVVFAGARTTLRGARVTRNVDTGVFVHRSHLDAQDLLVDNTLPGAVGAGGGIGIVVGENSTFTLRRARLSGNRNSGLYASGPNTALQLEDVVVDATLPDPVTGARGVAVEVRQAATLDGRRLWLVGNAHAGLGVYHDAVATLTDVVVGGTLQDTGDGAGGIIVLRGGRLQLERARVAGNAINGLLVGGLGSEAQVRDLLVDATVARIADSEHGRGLLAGSGAQLHVHGARVVHNHEFGVGSFLASMSGVGLRIQHTLPRPGRGDHGEGVVAYTENLEGPIGATLKLSASVVRANHTAGIIGFRSLITLDHVVTTDTRPANLDRHAYEDPSREYLHTLFADGLQSYRSDVRAHRSIFAANPRAGIIISGHPQATIERTVVATNSVGVVQQGGSAADYSTSIVYANRTTNHASDADFMLPKPPASVVLDGD